MAVNGNAAKLTLGGKAVNQEMSSDFGLKTGMIDITSKTSAGSKESMPGLKEYSLSLEAIFDQKPSGTPTEVYVADIFGWQMAGVEVNWSWQPTSTTGDIKFSGKCFIADCNFKAAHDDKVTYSLTLQITGIPVLGVV